MAKNLVAIQPFKYEVLEYVLLLDVAMDLPFPVPSTTP